MLTLDEIKYLSTISKFKIVSVLPYDPRTGEIAESLIGRIKNIFPDAELLFLGAAALGIAGQNDIDLHILSSPDKFSTYLKDLTEMFGKPKHSDCNFVEWNFQIDGFDIELYISDPSSAGMLRQMQVFTVLRKNSDLRNEYEQLKLSFVGKSYYDYQKAKYEFFNEILNKDISNF